MQIIKEKQFKSTTLRITKLGTGYYVESVSKTQTDLNGCPEVFTYNRFRTERKALNKFNKITA